MPFPVSWTNILWATSPPMALLLHMTLLIRTQNSSWVLTFQGLAQSLSPSVSLTFLHPLLSGEPLCQTTGAAAIFPRALQRVATVVKVTCILKSHPLILRPSSTHRLSPILQAFPGFLASLTSALPVYEPLLPRPPRCKELAALISAVRWTSNPHCVCFVGSLNPRQSQIKYGHFRMVPLWKKIWSCSPLLMEYFHLTRQSLALIISPFHRSEAYHYCPCRLKCFILKSLDYLPETYNTHNLKRGKKRKLTKPSCLKWNSNSLETL